MKRIILLSITLALALTAFTQQTASLKGNNVDTVYYGNNALINAYNASVAGDTIYLSGGGFPVPETFGKGISVIGAGFFPDSSTATLITSLTGDVYIGNAADGLTFEGVLINNNVYKLWNYVTNNVTLLRCKINGSVNMGLHGTPTGGTHSLAIIQSIIIGTIDLRGIENSIITNSIIQGNIFNSYGNLIQNNVLLYTLTYCCGFTLQSSSNNNVVNNIFHNAYTSGYISDGVSNIYINNVFTTPSPNLGTSPQDIGNYKGIDLSTVYVNHEGYEFSYSYDNHLQTAAAATYLGNDGTQVGIYGGLFMTKEGWVPQNPHISSKTIAPSTDNQGKLQINIVVTGQ